MSSIERREDATPAASVSEKRRRPIAAGLLSLLCPGLGQLYNADPFRALKIFGPIVVLQTFMSALLFWPPTFACFLGGLLALIAYAALYLYSIVAAVKTARRTASPG